MIYSIYTFRVKRYSYKHNKEKEKNKMKKSLSLSALSLVLAVSLSACGSKSGNSDPSASGTQNDSKDQITLTVVTWGGEGYLPKVSDAFTKEHPNVKVDFQKIATDYDSILRSKINAGQVPDIFMTSAGPTANKAYGEYSVDLANEAYMKDVADYAKKPITENGKVMGYPMVAQSLGIIYNKKIFADVGITKVPTTMDELTDVVKKLKAKGIIPYANDYKEDWELGHISQSFFAAEANGNSEQLAQDITAGKITFKDMKEFPKLLDYIDLTMKDGNSSAKPLEMDINTATALVGQGKAAMINQGDWVNEPVIQAGGSGTQIGFFPIPIGNDPSKAKLLVDATVWLRVNKDTEHLAVANQYLAFLQKWMNDNDNQLLPLKDLNMKPREGNQLVVSANDYAQKNQSVGWSGVYYPDGWDIGKQLQSYIGKTVTREQLLDNLTKSWLKTAKR
jgi:raffinose/stachyose/melibiose transport system substrate-binding protein